MKAKPDEVLGYLAQGHPILDGKGRTKAVSSISEPSCFARRIPECRAHSDGWFRRGAPIREGRFFIDIRARHPLTIGP